MNSLHNQFAVFCTFMRRDISVHGKDLLDHCINYLMISPLLFGFCFAFIQKSIYFGNDAHATQKGTIMFIGSIIIPLLIITYKLLAELLFDLEGNRFINYQMTILHPRLVLLQRIIFASVYAIALTVPFLPITRLIVGYHLNLDNIHWVYFVSIIIVSSFCCASYNMAVLTVLKVSHLKSFWIRVNWPLINLGGFWVPLTIIKKFSSILGALALFNPLTYIMEGLRCAVTGSSEFLSFGTCLIALCMYSIFFMHIARILFKKRVDHI
jgi:hypothetical protein